MPWGPAPSVTLFFGADCGTAHSLLAFSTAEPPPAPQLWWMPSSEGIIAWWQTLCDLRYRMPPWDALMRLPEGMQVPCMSAKVLLSFKDWWDKGYGDLCIGSVLQFVINKIVTSLQKWLQITMVKTMCSCHLWHFSASARLSATEFPRTNCSWCTVLHC